MDPITIILLGTIFIGVILSYGYYNIGHFNRNGLKALPSLPYIGNMFRVVILKENFKDLIVKNYKAFPEQRYIGVYQFSNRLVMIKDIELIKQVTIKDFDHFTDHFGVIDETADPLFGNNLFSLRGQKWRDMRATLSPAFTSSKMRNMFEFVAECGEQMANFYKKEMQNPENAKRGHIEVEMKDAFTRYTNDVIATTAFGIKVDSHSVRENHFYMMGKDSSTFTGLRAIKLFCFISNPNLSKFLGLKIFNDSLGNFFRNLVADSMKAREDGKFSRPDMIQLLMEAKKGSLKHDHESDAKTPDVKEAGFATVEESSIGKQSIKRNWSDDEIVSQAILFFIAGFDASSNLLCFVAHELAVNPDIQERLQEEIDEIAAKNNGKVTYNDLQGMKYMDMVVSETLRMWPPAVVTDRKCIKPYTLPPPTDSKDAREYQLPLNEGIWIPVWGIHHDEKFFPNPEKFDPERFSDENKGSIQPFTYLPFGLGPRNCIGSRFALMETKAVIFHLLLKFNFTVITKTSVPMVLATNTFNVVAKNGNWIGLKPRV